MFYFSITHNTLWYLPLMNSRSIFTPPCPTLALASNIYTLLTSSPSPQVPFFSVSYHYHIRHNSPHMHTIFFPYIIFEPVSTAIPSPYSFRNIITIQTHQHFGKILKDIFLLLLLFKTVWHSDKQGTQANIISTDFHFYTNKQVLPLHY